MAQSEQNLPVDNIDEFLKDLLDRANDPGVEIPDHIQTEQEFLDWVRNSADSDSSE